jgi:hypothetical protein
MVFLCLTWPPRDDDLEVDNDLHVFLAAATSPISLVFPPTAAAFELGLTGRSSGRTTRSSD